MQVIMNDDYFQSKGFLISTDRNLLDIGMIYKYLNEDSYWAQGIPLETLTKGIENSICFGVYQHKIQIGLARVVTDKATFAYLCDVFILPEFRRMGLSKWLIQSIVKYPELQGLRRWSLATADAHGLYSNLDLQRLHARKDGWKYLSLINRIKKRKNNHECEKADF